MKTLLLEQPGSLLLIGGVAAAIALVVLVKTGRKEALLAAIGIVLLTLALLGLERYTVTDREQVRDTIHALAAAVERNDLHSVLEHLSTERPEALRRAEAEFPRYRFSEVKVKSNLEIDVQEQNVPPRAKAAFNVTVLVSEPAVTCKTSGSLDSWS